MTSEMFTSSRVTLEEVIEAAVELGNASEAAKVPAHLKEAKRDATQTLSHLVFLAGQCGEARKVRAACEKDEPLNPQKGVVSKALKVREWLAQGRDIPAKAKGKGKAKSTVWQVGAGKEKSDFGAVITLAHLAKVGRFEAHTLPSYRQMYDRVLELEAELSTKEGEALTVRENRLQLAIFAGDIAPELAGLSADEILSRLNDPECPLSFRKAASEAEEAGRKLEGDERAAKALADEQATYLNGKAQALAWLEEAAKRGDKAMVMEILNAAKAQAEAFRKAEEAQALAILEQAQAPAPQAQAPEQAPAKAKRAKG
jgi:hypothetical protein